MAAAVQSRLAAAQAGAVNAARKPTKRSEKERLLPLINKCLVLQQGYWSFEWCHEREVVKCFFPLLYE